MKISISIIKIATIILFINCYSLKAQESKSTTLDFIHVESFEVMSQFFEYDKDVPLRRELLIKLMNQII